jgi:hypothetical protein
MVHALTWLQQPPPVADMTLTPPPWPPPGWETHCTHAPASRIGPPPLPSVLPQFHRHTPAGGVT